jgi:hypothetical protein
VRSGTTAFGSESRNRQWPRQPPVVTHSGHWRGDLAALVAAESALRIPTFPRASAIVLIVVATIRGILLMVVRNFQKILTRDEVDGEEHYLQVLKHPAGLIIVRDDQIARVMAPSAALELCSQLVSAIGDEPLAVEGAGGDSCSVGDLIRFLAQVRGNTEARLPGACRAKSLQPIIRSGRSLKRLGRRRGP